RKKNGTRGRNAAIIGETPWTRALRIAANRNASLCSSLRRASIARSIERTSSFFSTRSASYAPTALLTARAIPAPIDAERMIALCDSSAATATVPMMMPRIVSAPSNAPITKYRRTIGPTFVISSYSRIRRRQARKPMSSALDPELFADEFLEFGGGGPRHLQVRKTGLREIRLSAAFPVELRRDGPHEFRRVDWDLRPSR